MNRYVGIDLGTTNSAICSYDGAKLKLYRSPEQHPVTPSAIYKDKRSTYYGVRAYNMAPFAPNNSATLFKRLMGTSTPIRLSAIDLTMSPEECSAALLKVLYGYLPEDLRSCQDGGTVIAVPAAFNQMQKDATLAAAEMANLGKVSLMQEPVAAVMSVMRSRKSDGLFLIYDLGGGTLDVALAESTGGHVNLHAHGGIAMCGGRDWDRLIVNSVVKPWLQENFDIEEDFATDDRYTLLLRLALHAAEIAKIELASQEETTISRPETEVRTRDLTGSEIYLDVPLDRKTLDSLIESRINDSVVAAQELLERAHFAPQDVERIVFVGGPTLYRPLRDKVASNLGIPGSSDVDPMTAVAEGAALFAETIDWPNEKRGRKPERSGLSTGGACDIQLQYQSRTPQMNSQLAVRANTHVLPGSTVQIDSLDSGWSSGRVELKDGAMFALPLAKYGENTFKIFLFDPNGSPLFIAQDLINISRTTASIDSIPASHSIGVAAKDKIGGSVRLEYLVKAGDSLPKKGQKVFRSEESLRAGGAGVISFQLWEGEIEEPHTDNRLIGTIKITGSDFEGGAIHAGAELICDYEVADSGNISMAVSVPSVGSTFDQDHNFYSRQEGQLDFMQAAGQVLEESQVVGDRIEAISERVEDDRLDVAREKLSRVLEAESNSWDPEECKQGMEDVLEAKRLLARVRKDHLQTIREVELASVRAFFDKSVREFGKPSEIQAFENAVKAAQRSIERGTNEFESLLEDLKGMNWGILWRQDWFVMNTFKRFSGEPALFADQLQFRQLVLLGQQAAKADDIEKLREAVLRMYRIRVTVNSEDDAIGSVNILRG